MNLMVRTAGNAAPVIASMRREVQAIDRNLPLVGAQTQAEEIDGAFGSQRSLATLLSIFGMLALILTSVGLYGTMSQAVGRRTKELGIRAALGADHGDLLWMVLRQALWLIGVGVAIGVPLAAARDAVDREHAVRGEGRGCGDDGGRGVGDGCGRDGGGICTGPPGDADRCGEGAKGGVRVASESVPLDVN